jgi:hypothetical protein
MAENSLHGRGNTFNQSSFISPVENLLYKTVAELEKSSMLLSQAEALLAMSLHDALSDITPLQRHYFLAAVHELVSTGVIHTDAVIVSLRPRKME